EEEEETPEPTLKGGLGLDLSAMAEKRRLEKEARRLARPIFQPPETRRPEKTRLAEATTEIARRKVTPIDIHLGFDFRLMIVTGPNTGGKTVALKTLGLICLMAQCGLFIPAAEGSQVQLLDNILADIGDEQSLQQSLSTFSSHMKRMTAILQSAGQRTLVLLDEMGAGTDPAEGAALGRSIVDELDNIGCLAVVTTHLGEMKSIAFGNSRVRNANVEFDLESLRPLYHLRIGEAGKSHALAIARRLQLPEHVVDRAEDFINAAGGTSLKEMEDVQKLRLEAEKARQEALTAQAEAQRLKTELEKALEEQRTRDLSNEKLKQARERIKVGDRVVVPRLGYDRPGRIAKIDLKKRAVSVSIGHMKWDAQLDELLPIDDIGPPVSPKPQYKEPRG
ncbi:MAG: MutS-related protein, partial [Isosphaeraceae bacterium]